MHRTFCVVPDDTKNNNMLVSHTNKNKKLTIPSSKEHMHTNGWMEIIKRTE